MVVIALSYLDTSLSWVWQASSLPHRTCRRTRAWGPDCRAPGGLCWSMAACVSCTWAPSTRWEGTWLWVQRWVGSCRAVAIPARADLDDGDREVSFNHLCGSRGWQMGWPHWWQISLKSEKPQQCLLGQFLQNTLKGWQQTGENHRILVQVHAMHTTCLKGIGW